MDKMLLATTKNPHLVDAESQALSELDLLVCLKIWKMAMGSKGPLMLDPEDAEEKDMIVCSLVWGCCSLASLTEFCPRNHDTRLPATH
jgi:hypothetical protein